MKQKTVIFLGPQGSGKGTQANLITEYLCKVDPNRPVVDMQTGRVFRELAKEDNATGRRVKGLLDDGKLIPDFLTQVIIIEEFTRRVTKESHITFDGFPRNIAQAKFLDEALNFYNREDLVVVHLDTSDKVVRERLKGRGRIDDTDELINERLRLYAEVTKPMIEYYKERSNTTFTQINGALPIKTVTKNIIDALDI